MSSYSEMFAWLVFITMGLMHTMPTHRPGPAASVILTGEFDDASNCVCDHVTRH